jgi:hypothetical protein
VKKLIGLDVGKLRNVSIAKSNREERDKYYRIHNKYNTIANPTMVRLEFVIFRMD